MRIVELYIAEVGRHLPARSRGDLQQEIQSLIEDALEDASQKQGRPVDEDMAVEVLRKFGSPEKVAASYQPPRYLIGPRLFPTFLLVMRIVITVLGILAAVGLGVSLGRMDLAAASVGQTVMNAILEFISSALSALGNVVIIFAILQWLLPESAFQSGEWDPRKLLTEPDPERVSPAGQIAGIIFSLALILLLVFYPQWIGITSMVDGKWLMAPMLGPGFLTFIPAIVIMLAAGIVMNAILYRQGRWTTATRWFAIGLNIGSIILLASMLNAPALINIDAERLITQGWAGSTIQQFANLTSLFDTMFRIALGITLVMQVVEMVMRLVKTFRRQASFPAQLTR